jgi:hypothetical protein
VRRLWRSQRALRQPLVDASGRVAQEPGREHARAIEDEETGEGRGVGAHRGSIAKPVNWKRGENVVIVPAVSDEEARAKLPEGWTALTPYPRPTPGPKSPR